MEARSSNTEEITRSILSLNLGEERAFGNSGMKKKLLKVGVGRDTPKLGDKVLAHLIGSFPDNGAIFHSSRETGNLLPFTIGEAKHEVKDLEKCIQTMKKGERALFTVPARNFGSTASFPVLFDIEIRSLISVVNVTNDEGIIKKTLERGTKEGRPNLLDVVLVRYVVELMDGTIVAETPDQGVTFCVKDGHLCDALSLALVTMQCGDKVELTVQPQYGFRDDRRCSCVKMDVVPQNSVLKISLELVSFQPVIDILGNSKVLKKIIQEGEGKDVAGDGGSVLINYIAKLEDETIFQREGGTMEDESVVFDIGAGQVIAGLEIGAATMKKGEYAELTIHHEYAFADDEVVFELATVPRYSTVIYEVDMVDLGKKPVEADDDEGHVATNEGSSSGSN